MTGPLVCLADGYIIEVIEEKPTVMPSLAPGASVGTAVVTGWSNTVMWNDWSFNMFGGLAVSDTFNEEYKCVITSNSDDIVVPPFLHLLN